MTEKQAYEMDLALRKAGFFTWIMNDSRKGYSVVITGQRSPDGARCKMCLTPVVQQ